MPINGDFLIKHVRPADVDAVDAIFSPDFQAYLAAQLGMDDTDMKALVRAWTNTASHNPTEHVAPYVAAADQVSQGRWSEHSKTSVNTVFFVGRQQLETLTAVGNPANADKSFVVDFRSDPIILAVDVRSDGTFAPRRMVSGMNVSTDSAGNICHLNPRPQVSSAPMAVPQSPRIDPATAGLNGVIDLSHNNGALTVDDFTKAKAAGIRAVFHKATQGASFADPMFIPHLAAARSVGLRIGAYHFGTANDPDQQLAFFSETVRKSGLGPMPLVLDYEANASPSTSMSMQQAKTFLEKSQVRFGKTIGLYSGATIKDALGRTSDQAFGDSWLWLPAYGTTPSIQESWKRWTFWQYTDGTAGPGPHTIEGLKVLLDRSVFDGTEADLQTFWDQSSILIQPMSTVH
jgi:lysozyme